MENYPSTGIKALDRVVNNLFWGDNVVWQVDDITEYQKLVIPYVRDAIRQGRKTVYIRFGAHQPLLEPSEGLEIITLNADIGFEPFSTAVHQIITDKGRGAFYVFDCLSDLLSSWATDLMVGNFFMVTCPYLYQLDTLAYFTLLRDRHSYQTIARIRNTTQLLLDVYNLDNVRFIHPLKVWNRYSPTMFLPHRDDKDSFVPVTSSADAARLFGYISDRAKTHRKLDYWDKLFIDAERLLMENNDRQKISQTTELLCRLMIAKDERMLSLAEKCLSLQDLIDIKSRLIGTGFIGGKSVGMLLARKILANDENFDFKSILEEHDSFYIGSDIFHSFIVQNGLWQTRMEQKTEEGYFDKAEVLSEGILKGKFSVDIREEFMETIEYFGQSPIIIRSSSLLEDGFGNAFAGKYESVFLANQGTPEVRYQQFEDAVKFIYASTMNKDALAYRKKRSLDKADEQMSLLVQRVSGNHHNGYFFADIAGVGVSYNTFVWSKDLDPKAGMARIVFGLGTRAVNRVEDDYPRIVAMDNPLVRVEMSKENLRHFTQRFVDVIDLAGDKLSSVALGEIVANCDIPYLDLIAITDTSAEQKMAELGIEPVPQKILTFDNFLTKTEFTVILSNMLKTLESFYNYPVDIEFTANFAADKSLKFNLLQCRPLQTRGLGKKVKIPKDLKPDSIFFKTGNTFMGGSMSDSISMAVIVDPAKYIAASQQQKYAVARLIGKINSKAAKNTDIKAALLGPGRWGTTTASLGVPINFSEISHFAILGEMSYPKGNLMPEMSYGSHFFQDLVEGGIFYAAIFTERAEVIFNKAVIKDCQIDTASFVDDNNPVNDIVEIYDTSKLGLVIIADIISQQLVCYKTAK